MSTSAARFTGETPKNYDRILGPILFIPYAKDIAARARKLKPQNILELAAGTGIVTRILRDQVPHSAAIAATDLNEDMLNIARPRFKARENVSFDVVDAMALPQEDESYDMVLSQFGVMFFPDKVASYREALRVLKPGGTYLLNVWGSWDANPWAELAHARVAQFFEGDPPAFYKVPFHYHDEKQIKSDLEEAGFANVKIEHVAKVTDIPSTEDLAYAAVFGNPLADEIRELGGGVTPEQAVDALHEVLTEAFGPSPATMPIAALVISAERPSGKKKGLLSRLFGT